MSRPLRLYLLGLAQGVLLGVILALWLTWYQP